MAIRSACKCCGVTQDLDSFQKCAACAEIHAQLKDDPLGEPPSQHASYISKAAQIKWLRKNDAEFDAAYRKAAGL